MKITALDFSKAPSGMLVKRSPHQIKELCLKGKMKNQIGVMTGFDLYFDDANRVKDRSRKEVAELIKSL